MDTKQSAAIWLKHLVPLISISIAVSLLLLTPIWAFNWLREPFLGMLIEPNNVVSQINGPDWPARQLGVQWSDRVLAIDGQTVQTTREISELVNRNGFNPVEITFARPGEDSFTITVTPIKVQPRDFISLFIIPYLVGLTFLGIGLWAYILQSGQRSSRALVVFSSAVSLMTTTFLDMNTGHRVVLLWAFSLTVGAAAMVHLAIVFPQPLRFVRRWPITRYFHWVVPLIFAFPTAREILAPTTPYRYIDTWRWGYAYIILSVVFFVALLVGRVFRSSSAVIRQQSRVIVFGSILSLGPVVLFYLLPVAFSPVVPEFRAAIYFPLLTILPLSIAYAILRYRLLDIDRLFSQATTYLLTTATAVAVFYGLVGLVSFLIQERLPLNDPLVVAVYLFILVLGLIPARDAIQRILDRLFYRAPADYRRVLARLSSNLLVSPNFNRNLALLEAEVSNALNVSRFSTYLYDDDSGAYLRHETHRSQHAGLPETDPLIAALRNSSAPLWIPDRASCPPALQDSNIFTVMDCEVFVPLHYEGKLTGFFALGSLRSESPYSSEDLDFLTAVAGHSALSLENARLFSNLSRTLDETREMKNLMDDIFASIATGIITTDIKRKITLFNRAAEKILGLTNEHVLGQPLNEALPALRSELAIATSNVLDSGMVSTKEVSTHFPRRGDLYLRLSFSPLLDAYQNTKGATIVFEDLTEQRKLEAEQERIRQTFGKVVAPRVRDRLLADPSNLRLDGTKQTITLLFADLSGFTPLSEVTPAEKIFEILNYYLSLAAQVILEEEGTLDKFMGDAVMAMWNSPDLQADHAFRAVRAASAIIERSRIAHQHFSDPEYHLNFRIGVTTGPAMVGNVGTSELFNYTAIGDTVNLAQRLEVSARPGTVLLQKATYDLVSAEVEAVQLPPIHVKGREQVVHIYELKGIRQT